MEAVAVKRDPPACVFRLLGECLMYQGADAPSDSASRDAANKTEGGKKPAAFRELPPGASRVGLGSLAQAVQGSPAAVIGGAKPAQTDELLFPTEDELREINARNKAAGRAARPANASAGSVPAGPGPAGAGAAVGAAPGAGAGAAVIQTSSLLSTIDAEAWADFGGWYQQDHTVFYRPTGHKDKFVFSWLTLTGPQAGAGDASPPAKVFDYLMSKDAQGSCAKCHSVDAVEGKGRVVNFTPLTARTKPRSFTHFVHEPHFGVTGDRGCHTCHALEKGQPYLKSYEQSNPHDFASEFGAVKKDTCQTCHNSGMARQDCLLCHKYHVNDVITPITTTKVTSQ
ncbi:MAG: hypothetical protein HC841_06100 [Verrucomicrobiae bacterium]|nr:hypothetical protein [Verrucomicrobiae bacterium]